jgi:tRNA uracil 4-sulfurtransferase
MKLISLLSSGIDSPIATHLMLKNKHKIILLTIDNSPFNNFEKQNKKIKQIIQKLSNLHNTTLKHYTINIGEIHKTIKNQYDNKYTCIICKILMYKTAEIIAKKEKYNAILSGENLGQVASQTLDNLNILNQFTTLEILQPLLSFDKEETIKIARNIGTYDISKENDEGCKMVPTNPSTHTKKEKLDKELQKINNTIEKLLKKQIKKAQITTTKPNNN